MVADAIDHAANGDSVISAKVTSRARLTNPIARLLLTIALIAAAIWAPIPFPFKVPIVAIVALLILWLQHGSLVPAGLRWPRRPLPTLLWAVGTAALVVVGVGKLISPMLETLAGIETDYSGYGMLEGNLELALSLIGKAMISAAIAEEIVYRGFLLDQLVAMFGRGTIAKAAAVVVGGLVFALPHWSQGPVGVATVALAGMIFGAAFLASRRNLWALMLAHALVDIWGVTMLYLGVSG